MKTMLRIMMNSVITVAALFACIQANAASISFKGTPNAVKSHSMQWTSGTNIEVDNLSHLVVYASIPSLGSDLIDLFPGESVVFHSDYYYSGAYVNVSYADYPSSLTSKYVYNNYVLSVYDPYWMSQAKSTFKGPLTLKSAVNAR